jgi:hypothetical protein
LIVVAIGVLTPTKALFPDQGDVNLYLKKAGAFAAGGVPYRDFSFEYPPLAIVSMVVPYLVAAPFGQVTLDVYKVLFAGWEAILLGLLGLVLRRIVRGGGSAIPGSSERELAGRLLLLTTGAALALTWRYDLFPALLLMAGLAAALDGRSAGTGLAVAVGTLAKLFPVVALPALISRWLVPRDPRPVARSLATFGLVIALVLGPLLLLAGRDALAFVGYQVARGLEIESIGGGLAVLAGLVSGQPPELSFGFSAVNVEGSLAGSILGVLPVATIAAFGLLAMVGWRRIRDDVAAVGRVRPVTISTLTAASVLVLLVTSKVYSIQYVVWLVPLVALLPRQQFWLAAAAVALTMPIHPILFAALVRQEALPIVVLAARNVLVVVLTARVLLDLRGRGPATRETLPGPA